ncbi:hypothetical protein KXD93_01420 [Mucilaginibacter sp. BJC16-A38]|uniref:hypothetical protein n=1 Tax=Mucilaginibacter phenanthrenivorans TaxID=1234842 RepID=UPI0021581EF9|nr:hypothetical protein [Mucilaginibacter phenanthrenivorans]MCR8556280.1 hypothetical protein [Mucilaginibacter phenanthrenivorans]
MKQSNKYVAALIIVLVNVLTVTSLMAQTNMADLKNATPDQRAAFQTNMMKTKLKLDSPQVTKVQAINLKYAQKMEPILKGSDGRMSKARQAMALQKQKDGELQSVFTKDQFQQYQEFEQEMKSKLMSHMGSN